MTAKLTFSNVGISRGAMPLFTGVDFTLNSGQVVWVQGANGIGKTTLLHLAAGLARAEEGNVFWMQDNIACHPFDIVAFQGHQDALKPQFTPLEEMTLWAKLSGSRINIDIVLERVALSHRRDVPTGKLSAGQRRRLALARLVVSDRPIWAMDEPAAAMDAAGVALIEDLVTDHIAKGGAALIASHSPAKKLVTETRLIRLEAA